MVINTFSHLTLRTASKVYLCKFCLNQIEHSKDISILSKFPQTSSPMTLKVRTSSHKSTWHLDFVNIIDLRNLKKLHPLVQNFYKFKILTLKTAKIYIFNMSLTCHSYNNASLIMILSLIKNV